MGEEGGRACCLPGAPEWLFWGPSSFPAFPGWAAWVQPAGRPGECLLPLVPEQRACPVGLSRDCAGAGVKKAPRRRATLEVSTPVPQAEGVADTHMNVSTWWWPWPLRRAPLLSAFLEALDSTWTYSGTCTCLSSVCPSASVPPSSQDAHLSHHPLMGNSLALFSEKSSWPFLPQAGSWGVHLSCPVPGAWWGLRRAAVPSSWVSMLHRWLTLPPGGG